MNRSLLLLVIGCLTMFKSITQLTAQEYLEVSYNDYNLPNIFGYYEKGLAIPDSILNYNNECSRRVAIGRHLEKQGEFKAAIYWINLALIAKDATKQQVSATYNNLALFYNRRHDYLQAIKYSLKAIQHADNVRNKAIYKINIAWPYASVNDFDQALQQLDEGAKTLTRKGDTTWWMAVCFGVKAHIFQKQGQIQLSLETYREAYSYIVNKKLSPINSEIEQENIVKLKGTLLNNIASTYLLLEQPDSSLYYLKKTPEIWPLLSQYVQALIYETYGAAYLQKKQFTKGLKYLQKSLHISEQSNLNSVTLPAYKSLSKYYAQTGDYQKAYDYQNRYQDLYEQSISTDNIHKINQLHTRYALEKKDKEMAQKELQYNKRQLALQRRNSQLYLLIVSIGLSVLVIGILLRNQYNRNRFLKLQLKNAANENLLNQVQASLRGEETERERIARELHDHIMSELMATQLNLKDIAHYHPELKASSRYENILIQMEETTDQLRRTTHNMMPVGLKETGLATTIEAFLYRVSNHQLMISFQCFGEKVKLADSAEKIMLAITHELVQNVVKHAHATEALVQLNYYSDSLSLTVEDNGVGMPKQEETNDDGLGWHNIRRNVAALSGTVDIQSSEQEGTTVLIEIPL